MNLLRFRALSFACVLGIGSMFAQTQDDRSTFVTTGAHGFVENLDGTRGSGIDIPEDRDGAVSGMAHKTTNWTDANAVAVHYFHHPVAEVETKMFVKVKNQQQVTFKVSVYDPENLKEPLTTVENIKITGAANDAEQEISLVKYNFKKKGYYRYCLQCTSGCENIVEISKFKHYSTSAEETYKSGYLSSPSVHLNSWRSTDPSAPRGAVYDWCYQEVMMPQESDIKGTYAMSLGVLDGYMGIQMNGYSADGSPRHDIIFSMWDEGNVDVDPNLPDNLRANVLDKNPLAIAERFNNEGTGMKSFMAGNFWKCGTFVRFLTNCRKEIATYKVIEDGEEIVKQQENTLVTAWFDAQDGKGWQYISTLRLAAKHKRFDSWYSFLENYDWPTGQMQRKAYYRNGYACATEAGSNKWYHFNKVGLGHTDGGDAKGTRNDFGQGATAEYAGANGEQAFFMTTGGFVPANVTADEVALNTNDNCVADIDFDVLLKRVDQAIAHEKEVNAKNEVFKHMLSKNEGWQVVSFSSESNAEGGSAAQGKASSIIDNDNSTYWHPQWSPSAADVPHVLVVDMCSEKLVEAMEIAMGGRTDRYIKSFELYTSQDNKTWSETPTYSNSEVKVENGSFKFLLPAPVPCRYFKLKINSTTAENGNFVNIYEVNVAGTSDLDTKRAELKTLIDKTNAIIEKNCKTAPIDLAGRLSSNADHNHFNPNNLDGGGLAALYDGDINTYFHSSWGGEPIGAAHYVQVDLGADLNLGQFELAYALRNKKNDNSPAPTEFEVQRSSDGKIFENIATFTKKDGLPSYTAAGKYWKSPKLNAKGNRYIRFVVTKSEGPGIVKLGENYFFALSEFVLSQPVFSGDLLTAKNAVAKAQGVYENATTVDALTAEINALQQVYDDLMLVYGASMAKDKLSTYYNNPKMIRQTITGGTNPGFYSVESAKAYNEAYAAATTLLNQTVPATAEAYTASYKNLKAAFNGLNLLMPEKGKLYVLRSANSQDYSKGALVGVTADNLMYHDKSLAVTDSRAVWMLNPAQGIGHKFNMISLHTGEGVEFFISNKKTPLSTNVQPMDLEVLNLSGQVGLKSGNTMMHAQNNGSAIVNYNGGENTASAWYIEEVKEPVGCLAHVSAHQMAGLYLSYNATIPTGVTAYTASKVNTSSVSLMPIEGGIIPANTGVIIKAGEGDYVFNYTAEQPATPVSSLLSGSSYVKYEQGEANHSYYLFGVKTVNGTPQVGLYQAWLEYNAQGEKSNPGSDEGGYFKVSANKIYLDKAESAGVNHLSFVFGDVTGIEGVTTDSEDTIIYNLQGRRVYEVQQSGLYIVNGQKKFIKK